MNTVQTAAECKDMRSLESWQQIREGLLTKEE